MMHPCDRCGGQFGLDFAGNLIPHRAPCGAWCGRPPPLAPPEDAASCAEHSTGCDSADREPAVHELKTVAPWFGAVLDGSKTFDIRPDDRPFRAGDVLRLREYDPAAGYTGRECWRRVTFAMRGYHALAPGHVALGLAPAVAPEEAVHCADAALSSKELFASPESFDEVFGGFGAVEAMLHGPVRVGDEFLVREIRGRRACRRRVAFIRRGPYTVAPGYTMLGLAPDAVEPASDAPPDPMAATRQRLLAVAQAARVYRKAQSIASSFSYRSCGNVEDYDRAHDDVDVAAKALDAALDAAGLS